MLLYIYIYIYFVINTVRVVMCLNLFLFLYMYIYIIMKLSMPYINLMISSNLYEENIFFMNKVGISMWNMKIMFLLILIKFNDKDVCDIL